MIGAKRAKSRVRKAMIRLVNRPPLQVIAWNISRSDPNERLVYVNMRFRDRRDLSIDQMAIPFDLCLTDIVKLVAINKKFAAC